MFAIDIIRNRYLCDCKTMRESGWICEHILATLSLLQQIDLDDVFRAIRVRNKTDRLRKSRNPQDLDTNHSHFFKLLTDSPGHVFHRSVMKDFVIQRNGTDNNEDIADRIAGW
ncbi:hypothetical protein P3T76_009929 [Phytophthora citrophthora]|uniref:SWIM-type domain-containing protein n=1 Tax=Phytophthora citrophthora TaxID=4793 RepID=A0AAD9GEP4_9STRA|nr:hypothetical protein P3T76_009929 [Phytophthora citrophthora]